MGTIDKAALIEQAARVQWASCWPGVPWPADDAMTVETWSHDTAAALPVIAKALLAPLRELHKPVHLTFSWNSGIHADDPCETCGGKAGTHECGCWGDYDSPIYCNSCSAPGHYRQSVDYPCPTVRLLDAIEAEVQP